MTDGKRNWSDGGIEVVLAREMIVKEKDLTNGKPRGKWLILEVSGELSEAIDGFDSFIEADKAFVSIVEEMGGSTERYKVGI